MSRILVVDDDEKILDLLSLTLGLNNHDILVAKNIFDAEELACFDLGPS